MPKSKLASFITSLVVRSGEDRRFRKVLDQVLDDDAARDVILHRLGTRQLHNNVRLDSSLPAEAKDAREFEDLTWLLSSNYANRGLALLMLEEAAWLYDTIKAMGQPRVAELGRAKGGTTFLLASAGATVLSIENGTLEAANSRRFGPPEVAYDEALGNALNRVGIASRVEVVRGDAETHPVTPEEFDMVFVDIALPGDRMTRLFDRWWEGVKPGGRLVLRDGREPRTPTVMALAASLTGREDVQFEQPAPGVFTVLVKPGGPDSQSPSTGAGPIG